MKGNKNKVISRKNNNNTNSWIICVAWWGLEWHLRNLKDRILVHLTQTSKFDLADIAILLEIVQPPSPIPSPVVTPTEFMLLSH